MSTEAEIIAEIEELGRLTEEQEDILYNIALRQEELGRQPTYHAARESRRLSHLSAHDRS